LQRPPSCSYCKSIIHYSFLVSFSCILISVTYRDIYYHISHQRVQSRVRAQGNSCRVALQISSNPQNPSELAQLTIIMSVPTGILGETLRCNPPGGVWNDEKKVVLWCVSELGGGEKFQLQALFDIDATVLGEEGNLVEKIEFPVLARCQCSGFQLSAVAFEVTDMPDMYPAEVSKSLIRRFRVSHKEK